MPTPRWDDTWVEGLPLPLRQNLKRFFAQLGPWAGAIQLVNPDRPDGKWEIPASGISIGHGRYGAVPRWHYTEAEGVGTVRQTAPADSKFLYLAATATVVVALWVT